MRTKRRNERERMARERRRQRREQRQIRQARRALTRMAEEMRSKSEALMMSGATVWVAPIAPPPGAIDAQGERFPKGWTKVGELAGPVEFSHVGGRFRDVSIGYEVRPPAADDGRLN